MSSYGAKKKKDMIKSALPSTRRKGARDDRRAIHKAARRQTRQSITTHNGLDVDRLIDTVSDDADIRSYPNHAIRDMMWERRNGDHLGALMRWAPHQVKHLRLEDRLSYFKSILPDDTIGRHAASHIQWMDEFEVPRPNPYTPYDWAERRAKFERERRERDQFLLDSLAWICNNGFLKEYNRRRKTGEFPQLRMLLGLHDIESFVKDNSRGIHNNKSIYSEVEDFLTEKRKYDRI